MWKISLLDYITFIELWERPGVKVLTVLPGYFVTFVSKVTFFHKPIKFTLKLKQKLSIAVFKLKIRFCDNI